MNLMIKAHFLVTHTSYYNKEHLNIILKAQINRKRTSFFCCVPI